MFDRALVSDVQDKAGSRLGRPRGEIAVAVLRELTCAGPLTCRELATRLQVTVNVTKFTCTRLHARGEIVVSDRVWVDWSNRRVSRYAVANHGQRQAVIQLPPAFFLRSTG